MVPTVLGGRFKGNGSHTVKGNIYGGASFFSNVAKRLSEEKGVTLNPSSSPLGPYMTLIDAPDDVTFLPKGASSEEASLWRGAFLRKEAFFDFNLVFPLCIVSFEAKGLVTLEDPSTRQNRQVFRATCLWKGPF